MTEEKGSQFYRRIDGVTSFMDEPTRWVSPPLSANQQRQFTERPQHAPWEHHPLTCPFFDPLLDFRRDVLPNTPPRQCQYLSGIIYRQEARLSQRDRATR